jgi:glycosyltransferase involved in cell wall biosynthesis
MLLSLIVVAHNVDAYLGECLQSCLFEDGPSQEVIVVVNASTDATLAVAQSFARQYPEIFTVHAIPENIGLGPARNFGLQQARGDYIAYIDGDDWYDQAAGAKFAEVLAWADFDIGLFNHDRVYEDGRVTVNRRMVSVLEGMRVSAEEKGQLMLNLGTAWNKLLRRQFLLDGGFLFPNGYYEDVDWNFQVQIASAKTYVIPDVLIHYRQRTGSILRSTDVRHIELIDRFRALAAFLKQNPSLGRPYGQHIYYYCWGTVLRVLDSRRLPKSLRPRFMRQASFLLRQIRRLGPPSGTSMREPDALLQGAQLAGRPWTQIGAQAIERLRPDCRIHKIRP